MSSFEGGRRAACTIFNNFLNVIVLLFSKKLCLKVVNWFLIHYLQ